MALSKEEKAKRKRDRMIEFAKTLQLGTFAAKVARIFQKMIRAEAGAKHEVKFPAVVDGEVKYIKRELGYCVCITCGKVEPWNAGIERLHTGHFLASRRQSILFDEDNVAPQCAGCNYHNSGSPQEYRRWMIDQRGIEAVERLERLKTQSVTYSREELVDMRIDFSDRLKVAEESMKRGK